MKTVYMGVAAAVLTFGVAVAQTTTTTPSTAPTTVAPSTTTPMGATPPVTTTTPMAAPSALPNRAQMNPGNNNSTTPAAVATSQAPSKTAAAPVKGRNSFTMGEARRRIVAGGFSDVKGLRKDRDGIWRGTAMKDGASVPVYCDYQGNVGHT